MTDFQIGNCFENWVQQSSKLVIILKLVKFLKTVKKFSNDVRLKSLKNFKTHINISKIPIIITVLKIENGCNMIIFQ